MSEERTYFINGLPSLYDVLKKAGREDEGRRILEDFLTRSFNSDISKKIERFRNTGINPIPTWLKYFGIYAELMQAYINGLFYTTVVLAGTLCERVCFDTLSMQKIQIAEKHLTEKQISSLYDRDFSRNVKLLYAWDLIERETRDEMFKVYQKRIDYAHPKMKNVNPEQDALDMIQKITRILTNEFVKRAR